MGRSLCENDTSFGLRSSPEPSGVSLALIHGALEAGRAADVLVVDGDPRADLNTLTQVRMVIHSGEIIVKR
mgnify:CR=1 FL=1